MEAKKLTKKQLAAIRHIRNTFVHSGRAPSVRELQQALGYRSPHSAAFLIGQLVKAGVLGKNDAGVLRLLKDPVEQSDRTQTIDLPLVGTASCGPLMLAEENIEAMIPVSKAVAKPGYKYFLLKAGGDSMNKAGIKNSDILIIRQQPTADEGDIVVALVDDEATIKKIHYDKDVIILKPESKNKKYKPIILADDFKIQGVVISVLSNFY